MNSLVPVKKVAFGTPAFIFLRTNINLMIEERNYTTDLVRYRWLANTIRAMAELVYFMPPKNRKTNSAAAGPEKPVYYTKKQLAEKRKLTLKKSQKELF